MELPDISYKIWNEKYRLGSIDQTPQDTFERVSKNLSESESEEEEFYTVIKDFKFIPAGRILSSAGTVRKTTMVNCFVMNTIEDDLDSIFRVLGESARTMKYGGGIGVDFSTLRPCGSAVIGADAYSSGPLPFMDLWNTMSATIRSAGHRRGAMMGVMRVDNPDILDFIRAKLQKRFEHFNLSVLVTDDFMEKVKENLPFRLRFEGKVIDEKPARQIWEEILKCTYQVAEPGVIFIDKVNKRNNLKYREKITCTNPCGEQPLPPGGACVLGSINLAALVQFPFTDRAMIFSDDLIQATNIGIRMLDRVIDVTKYPLKSQEVESKKTRRIGLGITGLGDALAMCNVRYGSDRSIDLIKTWMEYIKNESYATSVNLAKEKGQFPDYDSEILKSPNVENLPEYLIRDISRYGLRNGTLTSIAPTGTISLFARNVSSGIEPIFAKKYSRKVIGDTGNKTDEVVTDYAVDLFEKLNPGQEHPESLISMKDLTINDHLRVQSTAQDMVDTSVSKTVNVPENISFEDFRNVYEKAYDLGCKSITTYRPNKIRGSVLEELEVESLNANGEVSNSQVEPSACTIDEYGTRTCE